MIYKRGNKLYTDVYVGKQRKRVSTGFNVGQEAQAMLAAAKLQAGEAVQGKRGAGPVSAVVTLQDGIHTAWDTWRTLKDHKMKRLHGTCALEFFGADRPLQEIDAGLIQRWINKLDALGNGAATINRKLAWLSGLLRINMEQRKVPERMPTFPRLHEAPKQRGYMTDEQVSKLIEAVDPEFQPLLVFLRDTGRRIREALGLQWSHCAQDSVTFVDTKAGDVRTMPLTEAAAAALEARRGEPGSGPFPWSYKMVSLHFRKAAKAAGVVLPEGTSVHLMRHTTAAQLVEKGLDTRSLQVWMGHHCVQTTEIYAKVTGSKLAWVRDLI